MKLMELEKKWRKFQKIDQIDEQIISSGGINIFQFSKNF